MTVLICLIISTSTSDSIFQMYHQLSRRYAILMNCLFATFSITLAVILFISSYLAPDVKKYPRTCFLSHAFDNPQYFSILFTQVCGYYNFKLVLSRAVWSMVSSRYCFSQSCGTRRNYYSRCPSA